MAFLVCYSKLLSDHHPNNKAVYLDQLFYELIFNYCRSEQSDYPILREIASLRYKSPVFVLSVRRVPSLDLELTKLEGAGKFHPQIAELKDVCHKALSSECALTISGDMYPEL
jgi:hypothetical protein